MPEIEPDVVVKIARKMGFTQTDLVEATGISRSQIGRIFRGSATELREKTLFELAKGLGVNASDLEIGGAERSYLTWVRDCHQFVDFRGMGLPQLKKEKIEEVFVEPEAGVQEISRDCDQHQGAEYWSLMKPTGAPASQIIKSAKRVVVIGNPGDGKTTLLRKICYDLAESIEPERLPIFFRLPAASRAFQIDPKAKLLDVILSTIPDSSREFVRQCAEEKFGCTFVLDGLDEVGGESERATLIRKTSELIASVSGNHFIVSSRVIGFDEKPWEQEEFAIVGLLDFKKKQIDEFAEKWSVVLCRIFDRPRDSVLESLRLAVFSSQQVRSLVGNPLILTILAVLNESRGGGLPQRRVDLYSKIVEVFLDSWERTKRLSNFDETSDLDLDSREFEWLLADLALEMQRDRKTLAPRWWLRERISEFLFKRLGVETETAKDAGERVLRYLSERTGLIEERGLKEYGFSHRTLQEYFAAIGILGEIETGTTIPKLLSSCVYDPQWEEVIRLVAAKVTPPVAESLLREIADDRDPVGRFLHRGQLLSLRCLSDGVRIPSRQLVEEIFEGCTAVGDSKWLGITIEILETLDQFAGSRNQALSESCRGKILDIAKEKLPPDEYMWIEHATNFDFFIDSIKDKELENADEETPVFISNESDSPFLFLVNHTFKSKKPAKWLKKVEAMLLGDSLGAESKRVLIRHVGGFSENRPASEKVLKKIFKTSKDEEVRACAVWALRELRTTQSSTWFEKLAFSNEANVAVRAAAIRALESEISKNSELRQAVIEMLFSDLPTELRSATARALSESIESENDIRDGLLGIAQNTAESDGLRSACLWTLFEGSDNRSELVIVLESILSDDTNRKCDSLKRCASQLYIDSITEDSEIWDDSLVSIAEQQLMGSTCPCPHTLQTLRRLATARFLRRGTSADFVIRKLLSPMKNKIDFAFIFGSSARHQQSSDSDIDLFVLGDVSLKELSPHLRDAEDTLGKPINLVVYPEASFVEKYQRGDPFLADVVQREKLPVLPEQITGKEIKDELRRLASVSVA